MGGPARWVDFLHMVGDPGSGFPFYGSRFPERRSPLHLASSLVKKDEGISVS